MKKCSSYQCQSIERIAYSIRCPNQSNFTHAISCARVWSKSLVVHWTVDYVSFAIKEWQKGFCCDNLVQIVAAATDWICNSFDWLTLICVAFRYDIILNWCDWTSWAKYLRPSVDNRFVKVWRRQTDRFWYSMIDFQRSDLADYLRLSLARTWVFVWNTPSVRQNAICHIWHVKPWISVTDWLEAWRCTVLDCYLFR